MTSIRKADLSLPNSSAPQPAHKFRVCAKCEKTRPPEGGLELSPEKWICARCWAARAARRVGGPR